MPLKGLLVEINVEGCAVFFSATFSVVIYGLVFGSWSFLGLCMIPVWGVGLKNALEGFGALFVG